MVETSQPLDGDEEQDLPKDEISDPTKEAYQVETKSLSGDDSIDAGEKDYADDDDFQPGTISSSDNDDDDNDNMESEENFQRGHKRKNQG